MSVGNVDSAGVRFDDNPLLKKYIKIFTQNALNPSINTSYVTLLCVYATGDFCPSPAGCSAPCSPTAFNNAELAIVLDYFYSNQIADHIKSRTYFDRRTAITVSHQSASSMYYEFLF